MLVLSVFGAEKPIQISNWQTWMRRLDIKAAVGALNSPITNRRSRYKEYQAPRRKAKEEIFWEHMRVDGVNDSWSKRGWQCCKYKEKSLLYESSQRSTRVVESSWEFLPGLTKVRVLIQLSSGTIEEPNRALWKTKTSWKDTSMCGAILFAVSGSRLRTSTVRLDSLYKLQEYCILISSDVSQQGN